MSGFQRLAGGTLMSFTLLYSVVFHLMFESVHSCKMIRSVISVLGQNVNEAKNATHAFDLIFFFSTFAKLIDEG